MFQALLQQVAIMTTHQTFVATKIDSYLQALATDAEFSGAVIQAWDGKLILNRGYGAADRVTGLANTPDTIFPIGSLTKPFTALAVLLLVTHKQLDLNDRIRSYLSECPAHWNRITVHHLLTHTSGLPNITALSHYDLRQILPAQHWTVIAPIAELPLDFEPNTGWAYSNTGYLLLGALIERVTQQSYAQFLTDTLFRPLGMEHTDCTPPDRTVGQAQGYIRSGDTITQSPALDLSYCPAAGGLYSTVNDLYRWCQSLTTATLFPPEMLTLMEVRHTAVDAAQSEYYGYGWALRDAFGTQLAYHDGRLSGYKHCLGRLRDYEITTIVLSNYDWVKPCLIAQAINTITVERNEQKP
jgi:CubicO group peptidase (beta-lactamase class C family)